MSNFCCNFARKIERKDIIMTTMTVQIPNAQAIWFEQMIQAMGWSFSKSNDSVVVSKDKHQEITPAMRRQINAARKEYAEGKTISCRTPQEMQQFFDSL